MPDNRSADPVVTTMIANSFCLIGQIAEGSHTAYFRTDRATCSSRELRVRDALDAAR